MMTLLLRWERCAGEEMLTFMFERLHEKCDCIANNVIRSPFAIRPKKITETSIEFAQKNQINFHYVRV